VKLVTIAIAVVMGLLLSRANAQETPWTKQDALHETSNEAAQCMAYYAFSQKCASNAGNTALHDQIQQAIDLATRITFTSGKASGMSNEALLASLKLALDDTQASIGNSCVNISVLVVKYADSCRSLLEHPDDRVQTLMHGPPKARGQ
jgi:hypothetical protein